MEINASPQICDQHRATARHNLLSEFASSAVYSGIQEPVIGIAELVEHISPFHCTDQLSDKIHFMEKPEDTSFGSSTWHAQTFGNGLGKLVPFITSAVLAKWGLGKLGVSEFVTIGNTPVRSTIGFSLEESFATGLVAGSVFSTAHNKDHFLKDRLLNGMCEAVTFSAMNKCANGLSTLSELNALHKTGMDAVLRNQIVSGALSGIPGGLLSSEFDALRFQGRKATGKECLESIYSMGIVGAAFGTNEFAKEKYVARNLSESQLSLKWVGQDPDNSIFPFQKHAAQLDDMPKIMQIEHQAFPDDPSGVRGFLRSLIKNKDSAVSIVAKKDNDIQGCLFYGIDKEKNLLMVYNLAVANTARGKGIGQALMEHALNDMPRTNIDKAILHVKCHNQPAKQLYQKLGFAITDQIPGSFPGTIHGLVMTYQLPKTNHQ